MLIKKLITSVAEESFEIQMPMYLKERGPIPSYVRADEHSAIEVVNGCLIMVNNYINGPDRKISEYLSKCDPIGEEEFFNAYNEALANIQSRLIPVNA